MGIQDDSRTVVEEVENRYVSLLTNSGFKAVFGDRKNEDVVISVINALLPAHRRVKTIEYCQTELQGRMLESKEFRYDFMCRGEDGTAFIVEMQCYPDDYWFRRCVSYASRAYDRQNRKGEGYDVAPVYLIGLMGTPLRHDSPDEWRDRFVSEWTFMEKTSHELQDETIIIIFAELARFDRTLEQCKDDLERMLYVLKNTGRMKKVPESLKRKVFARILEACDRDNFSEEKRIQYDQDMYDELRRLGELATAKRIGREEGREEGLEEGRVKGREEGREEGLEKGREEGAKGARLEDARRLKELGVDLEIISKATGLSVETISDL